MKKILLSLVALAATMTMNAQDRMEIVVGSTADATSIPVDVYVINEKDAAGIEASFALPAGLTADNFNEDDDAADTYCVLGDRATKNHLKNTVEMFTKSAPNDLLVSITAGAKADKIVAGNDVFISFSFDGSSLADGTYAVTMKNPKVMYSGAAGDLAKGEDVTAEFTIAAGVVTAIKGINADKKNGSVYNVAGQRVNGLQKGINIVNGKKVFVK